MNASARRVAVIILSFAVVGLSGAATYAVWDLLPGVQALERGVVSLLSWVVTFYIGVFLFWKTVVRISAVP